ncbi:restriction endonuclease subunit S [Stenotrophomonas sp. SY1]|uniref:restriction endonuclease subunit S n=1 Tax=Stenotrophomonas sp. SY1 TaxID=477235 RepID=UPI001E55777E|nr:restriction endonuclease subunit S [Stenotrophomonas sp. SY1]MCD9085814.1 restriction endonuclease subunit S [Stenotrophomonas sp. SY1]
MKDSGVKWLEEVPETWDTAPLKSFLQLRRDIVGTESANTKLLSLTLQGVIERDLENKAGKLPASFDSYQRIAAGEMVFCLFDMDETPRTVGVAPQDGMLTGAYTVFRPKNEIWARYLYYFFLHVDEYKRLKPFYKGLRKTIRPGPFLSIQVPHPDELKAQAIVDFLDRATSRIDTLIAKKTSFIELLREKRQALITHAVTKGLDPNVPMKESGVEWLGEVPAHWSVGQSRRLFRERNEKARNGDIQLTVSQKYGLLPQTEFMEREGRRVVVVQKGQEILKRAYAGDFVISMRSFQGGLEYSEHHGSVSSAYVPLVPIKMVVPRYFRWLFKSSTYIQALQSTSDLVRDGQALRFENFTKVPLPVASKDEQSQIADFLDRATTRIDTLIAKTEQSIELLHEHRTALITAGVTGKIDLSN